ncbi:MAG TPA: alpha/beta fold hydrolase [Actinomycetota bacterium]
MSTEIVPGAEPFFFPGGDVAVLMLHGFTGNPSSIRPWGEALAERGFTVSGPRLPGHGTTWQDLATRRGDEWVAEADAALTRLRGDGGRVVICAQSFGGTIALDLASRRPGDVRGIVLVNPYVRDPRHVWLPVVRPFLRTIKGIGNDIKKPGGNELPYPRVPLRAVSEVARMMKRLETVIPSIVQPLLLFHSPQDHVVPRGTAEWLLDRIGSEDKELVLLPDSYHVAALDNDAPTIFERSAAFIERVTRG